MDRKNCASQIIPAIRYHKAQLLMDPEICHDHINGRESWAPALAILSILLEMIQGEIFDWFLA